MFWNPGCGHCRAMEPALREWSGPPAALLVSCAAARAKGWKRGRCSIPASRPGACSARAGRRWRSASTPTDASPPASWPAGTPRSRSPVAVPSRYGGGAMIDDLARELARPMPRRRALRVLGGAVAVAVDPGPARAGGRRGVVRRARLQRQVLLRDRLEDARACRVSAATRPTRAAGRWRTRAIPTTSTAGAAARATSCGDEFEYVSARSARRRSSSAASTAATRTPPAARSTTAAACCPDGHDCVKQITPGNVGITPDSPYVCCPAEQLVTALTVSKICCPDGSVVQPGGGLSTAGGLCCTAGNVCAGRDCCDSTPSFPKECVNGRCEFEFLRDRGAVGQDRARRDRQGAGDDEAGAPCDRLDRRRGRDGERRRRQAGRARAAQGRREARAPNGADQALPPRAADAAQAALAEACMSSSRCRTRTARRRRRCP